MRKGHKEKIFNKSLRFFAMFLEACGKKIWKTRKFLFTFNEK